LAGDLGTGKQFFILKIDADIHHFVFMPHAESALKNCWRMLSKRIEAIIFRNFKRYKKYLKNKNLKKNVLDTCKWAKNQT
jgi:hypothetical protein